MEAMQNKEAAMKRGIFLVCLLMGMVMVIALSGCNIMTVSPNTNKLIEMNPGDTIVFKVNGVGLNTAVTKCVWYINGAFYLEGKDKFEFRVKPEGEQTNRLKIICSLNHYESYNTQEGIRWHWVGIDNRSWNIRILQNTAPVWQGDYYIEDSTDMLLLNGYTDVTGSLVINADIENMEGLSELKTIGGGLHISGNKYIKDLSAFANITSVGEALNICDNDALTSLSGIKNLKFGGGLCISGNDALTNLSGLESIISVGGDLDISSNNSLTTLSALENITSIKGRLYIAVNSALTVLGMSGLHSVSTYFTIFGNQLLCKSLAEELRDQVTIGKDIYIFGNKDCMTP
jgi:hypothetical protein